jgi:acyl-coenzyme A thioesterase PaaI-like protein
VTPEPTLEIARRLATAHGAETAAPADIRALAAAHLRLRARVEGDLVQSHSDAVRAGMERARADGRHLGRPRAEVDLSRLAALWADGLGIRGIARRMGLPRATVRRRLVEAGLWPREGRDGCE